MLLQALPLVLLIKLTNRVDAGQNNNNEVAPNDNQLNARGLTNEHGEGDETTKGFYSAVKHRCGKWRLIPQHNQQEVRNELNL